MSTKDNLTEAFAGESQANRKYLAFAQKADRDGFLQVARLFRAAAEAETVHAHAHLRALGGIQSTAQNLAAAIEGEGFEFKSMYPPYVSEAREEGQKQAQISFQNALAVEEIHYNLYRAALEAVEAGGDLPDRKVYVCAVCGNTVYDEAPDKCEICGAPRPQFKEIS
ncbi:MAG: rubrerythrin family protein [Candidatus Krumholzibacteriota bacterium]|nr:rubrerythrin family protein [Candidatus Krumholzibacteriota bacterium]